jgi:hypothetical protein
MKQNKKSYEKVKNGASSEFPFNGPCLASSTRTHLI